MIGIYIMAAMLIVGLVLSFRSKSKFIQIAGLPVAFILSLVLLPYILKHSEEVNDQGYITIHEISDSIKTAQNEDAAQLRALIRSKLSDDKVTLSEFEEIGEAYGLYRKKYSLTR